MIKAEKSISSLPEASSFRSSLVIIIILICVASFLSFTSHLSDSAQDVARERVISSIKFSLSMLLYDYAIQGKHQQLQKFDRENPFVILARYRSLPADYRGVVAEITSDLSPGWYFENDTRSLVHVINNKRSYRYILKYQKGRDDVAGYLKLLEV